MIKIIHLIMLGEKRALSNVELSCVESWKKIYPDFEIKVWTEKNSAHWILESPFAKWNYEHGYFAYVADYLRCKVTYEYGGLYMDSDVYAINRIPDRYFEKSFMAWDVYNVTTNNGTCFYACAPKLPLFKEFCDCMSNLECVAKNKKRSGAANDNINVVLEKYGLDMSTPGYCDRDQDLGPIVVLNRAEFGGRARQQQGYSSDTIKPYLVHACSGTWQNVSTFYNFVDLKYAILDKNTDMDKLKERIKEAFLKNRRTAALMLFLVDQIKFSPEFDKFLRENTGGAFDTYCVPCGNSRKKALDYIGRKIADINSCSDIMRERNV